MYSKCYRLRDGGHVKEVIISIVREDFRPFCYWIGKRQGRHE